MQQRQFQKQTATYLYTRKYGSVQGKHRGTKSNNQDTEVLRMSQSLADWFFNFRRPTLPRRPDETRRQRWSSASASEEMSLPLDVKLQKYLFPQTPVEGCPLSSR